MSLYDDILALSPVLHWPLNETSGSTAEDVSGHGKVGTLSGPYIRGQYGAQAGTVTTQFAIGGAVTCTGFPQLAAASFTVIWWSTYSQAGVTGAFPMLSHRNTTPNRGWLWWCNNSDQHFLQAYNGSGSVQATAPIAIPTWARWWHGWAIVYTTGVGFVVYCDGSTVVTMPKTDWASTLSTDTFGWTSSFGSVAQNFAYYDKALTLLQIQALHAYRYDWPFMPPINATWQSSPSAGGSAFLDPTDPIIIQQQADTADIRRAVIRDYSAPPPGPITP